MNLCLLLKNSFKNVKNEEEIPKSARKKPRRQRQTGIMQFFLQKRMNKIAFGRIIDKCLITTGLNYLTNFDLKVFLRQVPKLHHYTGPKNWGNLETRCNLESLVQFEEILEIAAYLLDMVHELMFVAQK